MVWWTNNTWITLVEKKQLILYWKREITHHWLLLKYLLLYWIYFLKLLTLFLILKILSNGTYIQTYTYILLSFFSSSFFPPSLPSLFFLLFRATLQHMEVPRLGVQSELQLLAYPTATQDLSHVCYLRHSSWQCQVLIHWAVPGIKSASSWILDGFVTTESQWELLCTFFLYPNLNVSCALFSLVIILAKCIWGL